MFSNDSQIGDFVKSAPKPKNEKERLAALKRLEILDTLPEQSYDDITKIASYVCQAPIALVSLIDGDRQWFKSRVGLDATETPRDIAFCAHAILEEELFYVPDSSKDERFADNPLVTGHPNVAFYAGAPLETAEGHRLGTLCVIDNKPRVFTDEQKDILTMLSRQVTQLLEYRVINENLKRETKIAKTMTRFFENSQDLMCVAGTDGFFKEVSPSFTEVLGYAVSELLGRPFLDFVHKDDIALTIKEVGKLAQGHRTVNFQNRYQTKDGRWLILSWTSSPSADGSTIYAIARDSTVEIQKQNELLKSYEEIKATRAELVRPKEEAIEASNAKSRFLANMSHELRTPMNAILGYSDLLIEEIDSSQPAVIEDVKKIKSAGDHLMRLINEILDLSKVEAGKMGVSRDTFKVAEVIGQVEGLVRSLIGKNQNKLAFDISKAPAAFNTDQEKYKQILINLISNSAKFTKSGNICVRVFEDNAAGVALMVTEISDSGIGIPTDKLESIFSEFSQVDESTTRLYGGTGLGLSICRKFADILGGKLSVKSELGKGSTFTLRLPSLAAKKSKSSSSQAPSKKGSKRAA